MPVELVTGTFEHRVGETFTASPSLGGEPVELTLSSCDESAHARPDHPAFSLTFDEPGPGYLPQQIFTLRHAELGEFELFLVPIGPEQYEAVVN
jgi:Domain of unknown function (DUF6916)